MAGANHRGRSTDFPPAYVRFIELFNQGQYWESHEALEALWRENKSPFLKGVIIYASAFVHAQRGNPNGVRKQLLKARRYLEPYRPKYLGLDIDRLCEHLATCLEIVLVDDPPVGDRLTASITFDTLSLSPACLRGDEPERSGTSPT